MSKIITIGVPYNIFGLYNLADIKRVLIARIKDQWTYENYDGKIVNAAMRLPDEVADKIRAEAKSNSVNNLKYTAAILALKGV